MRTVRPTPLLRDAAEVLDPIRDDVVVIGALAVQVALDGHNVVLAATRDVDAAVETAVVDGVVAHLMARGLRPSELPHERAFTWVRRDLKVQLLRPFHPFPKGPARGLPVNPLVSALADHRVLVAFDASPARGQGAARSVSCDGWTSADASGRARQRSRPQP